MQVNMGCAALLSHMAISAKAKTSTLRSAILKDAKCVLAVSGSQWRFVLQADCDIPFGQALTEGGVKGEVNLVACSCCMLDKAVALHAAGL